MRRETLKWRRKIWRAELKKRGGLRLPRRQDADPAENKPVKVRAFHRYAYGVHQWVAAHRRSWPRR